MFLIIALSFMFTGTGECFQGNNLVLLKSCVDAHLVDKTATIGALPTSLLIPHSNPNPTSALTADTSSKSKYNYLVRTASQLKDAAAKAISGQVIYVADNAKINMTGQGTLILN